MEQSLKDELARVRAREPRYKSIAEARIATLEEQLAAKNAAENNASTAVASLEARCRQWEKECVALQERAASMQTQLDAIKAAVQSATADKVALENRCQERENEVSQLKKQAETSSAEKEKLKDRCKELENDVASLKGSRQGLEQLLASRRNLRDKVRALDGLVTSALFLLEHEQEFLEGLRKHHYSAGETPGEVICLCGKAEALTAVWAAVREMVSNGADAIGARACLHGLLSWYIQNTSRYNLSGTRKLKYYYTEQPKASSILGFFMGGWRDEEAIRKDGGFLPGLADADGNVLVKRLVEPRYRRK